MRFFLEKHPEFRNQLIRQPSNVLTQYNISNEAKSIIENSINDLTLYLEEVILPNIVKPRMNTPSRVIRVGVIIKVEL